MKAELSPKQEAFCVAFAENGGNATQAYLDRYHPRSENTAAACASKLLRNAKIINRIRELQDTAAEPQITSMTRVKAYWSQVMHDPDEKTADRLRASELFAKAAGAFLHFRPDPNDPGTYAVGEVDGGDVLIYLPEIGNPADFETDEDDDPDNLETMEADKPHEPTIDPR